MSAEKSHEWLIDALYAEHDEQPDNPTSEELTASEESARSQRVASYEAMLGELREGLVMYTPRSEVSDSIRAAARKQAEVFAAERAEQGARPGRRAPSTSATSAHSFWSRAKRQGILQLVAVLAVCLGAGLLVRTMSFGQNEAMEARFEAASESIEEEVAFGEGGVEHNATPEAPAEQVARGSDFKTYDYDTRGDIAAKPTEESEPKDIALALREEGKQAQNEIDQLEKKATVRKQRSKRAPSREVATKSSKNSLADELWGTSSPSATKKDESARKLDAYTDDGSLSMFGGSEDIAQEKEMAKAPSSSGRAESLGNTMEPAPSTAPAAPQEAMEDPEMDEEVASKSSDVAVGGITAEERARSSVTLGEAERAFKRNDYEQTVSDADAYLSSGVGTNNERARAMELKAQALSKLGRDGEAQALYEEIREAYPDYYRKEKLSDQKKQRKAAPKKKISVDSYEAPRSTQSF